MAHPLVETSQPRAGYSVSEPWFLICKWGWSYQISDQRARCTCGSDKCARQSLGSLQTDCSCSGNGTHHHVIICTWAWHLSREPVVSWPGQPVPFTPHSSAGTECLGGTHTAPSYLPRQASCAMHLPPGAASLTGEGVCLPHPNFPDTSCRLQVLGACSADTDRIWASLSIHFLLTSTFKSLKLKTRAVRPRAGNGMTTEPEVRQVQP